MMMLLVEVDDGHGHSVVEDGDTVDTMKITLPLSPIA